jgi:hypothetical protein
MKRAVRRVAMGGVAIALLQLSGCAGRHQARVQEPAPAQGLTVPTPPRQLPSPTEQRDETAPPVRPPARRNQPSSRTTGPVSRCPLQARRSSPCSRRPTNGCAPATWRMPRPSSNAPCVWSRRIPCCGTVWRQCACSKGSSSRRPAWRPNPIPGWQQPATPGQQLGHHRPGQTTARRYGRRPCRQGKGARAAIAAALHGSHYPSECHTQLHNALGP